MKVYVLICIAFAHAEVKKLTDEELARILAWKPADKQNIWELSGQFEGDIILNLEQRNGLISEAYHWPKKEIPYEIDSAISEEESYLIKLALSKYEDTCVRTVEKQPSDTDYVYITNEDSGCWSSVGRQGGKQILNLQSGRCYINGTIVHEFLHAFGFYHEQSSSNRDDFVTIHWENIMEGLEHNFNKYPASTVTDYGEPYDYGSVMHYSEYAFSKNGEMTIVPNDPDAVLGQREGLSKIDLAKLNKMYGCS